MGSTLIWLFNYIFLFYLGDYYLRIQILSREYYLPWQSIRQHSLTPSFTQGRLLFVLIFNIYIGQSNYLKISLLGPTMLDPTIVTYNFYLILRFLLSIYFISSYTFYIENSFYRDNPSVSIRWHLPLHKEGFCLC